MQIGLRSEVVSINRLKPEELPARYWRWAEPRQTDESQRADGVELSLRARWMNQLMANTTAAPIQSERINQIRAELKDGTYETPSKLERALDRMIDDVASI